jgi:alpha,alpha-trehalase
MSPDELYGNLFSDVQGLDMLEDSKVFVDSIPKFKPIEIVEKYNRVKNEKNFDLSSFMEESFNFPEEFSHVESDVVPSTPTEYIELLWPKLSRRDTADENSSLICLPNEYVVPGGRFREVYYWDSYFTMLGLADSGRVDLIESMVNNFSYLIDQFGFIPNGSRTYYTTRSQPPFFVLMVELLVSVKSDERIWMDYLPQLQAEYDFWMSGSDNLLFKGDSTRRVVRFDEGLFLNRYWDDSSKPRPESFKEDTEMSSYSSENDEVFYRHIRAAAESGWDFGSRWFSDQKNIETINTTNVIPVDLNCLMYKIEITLSRLYSVLGNSEKSVDLNEKAENRKKLIKSLFYDPFSGMFVDLLLPNFEKSKSLTLAGVLPLFFNIASKDQAQDVAKTLSNDFLKSGGWVQSLVDTGQQWDYPNGWAPSQWMVYQGLLNYGIDELAKEGAERWVKNITLLFNQNGKILEKYNVIEPNILASGGEYSVQNGFGWTNGTFLCFIKGLAKKNNV